MTTAPRELLAYAPWRRLCRRAKFIISSTEESMRHALEYFKNQVKAESHVFCYPAINTRVASSIEKLPRENRILFFGRFLDRDVHKGGANVPDLFCEEMRNHTLVLVVGTASKPPANFAQWQAQAREYGIELECLFTLSDVQKFRELKRSRLLLFPSMFEGFGYPPVEAIYCGVPCVAFDLPVIRETCGDRVHYSAIGDWKGFRSQIGRILSQRLDQTCREEILPFATFESYANRMKGLVERLVG